MLCFKSFNSAIFYFFYSQMIQNEIFCRTGIFFSRIACLSTCSETFSLVLALHLVRLLDCLLACLFRSQVWLWSLESDYDLLHARCDATIKPCLTPFIRCTLLCSCAVGPTDRQTNKRAYCRIEPHARS